MQGRHNRHAQISAAGVKKVTSKANLVCEQECLGLDEAEKKIWTLIQAANELSSKISSGDLPDDHPDNTVIVHMVQQEADKILNDHNTRSWLQKIIDVALYSKNFSAGNCQEKAFFGFAFMLHNMVRQGIQFESLYLSYFKNHFVVIINNRFLLDPWLNLAFPLDKQDPMKHIKYVFSGFGTLTDFYSINLQQGTRYCYGHMLREDSVGTQYDAWSTQMLPDCLEKLASSQVFQAAETEVKSQLVHGDSGKVSVKHVTQISSAMFAPPAKRSRGTDAVAEAENASTIPAAATSSSIIPASATASTNANPDEILLFDSFDGPV